VTFGQLAFNVGGIQLGDIRESDIRTVDIRPVDIQSGDIMPLYRDYIAPLLHHTPQTLHAYKKRLMTTLQLHYFAEKLCLVLVNLTCLPKFADTRFQGLALQPEQKPFDTKALNNIHNCCVFCHLFILVLSNVLYKIVQLKCTYD
jgi:hypothetical protein